MPHSKIQVELGLILQAGTCQILNFAQNPSQSVQGTELNWWGGDTAQKKCIPGGGDTAQKKCVLGKGGTTYTGREGDTAHTLLMGKQLGWGNCTTLKGNILGNPPDTFKTPSIEHYRHLPDIFRHLSDILKHIPDISHTSPRHPRLREEYKS